MSAIWLVAYADEVRGSHLAQLFVDLKISVGKQGERNIIGFPEVVDLKSRVADADTDDFDPSPILGIAFDISVDLIDSGSLPLTVRSVHAENLYDDDRSVNLRYGKLLFILDPEIRPVLWLVGHRQNDIRQHPAYRRRLCGC